MKKLFFTLSLLLIATVLLLSGCGGGGGGNSSSSDEIPPSSGATTDNLTVTWPEYSYVSGKIPIKAVITVPSGATLTQVQFLANGEIIKNFTTPTLDFTWDTDSTADGDYLCKIMVKTSAGEFSAEKTLKVRHNMANITLAYTDGGTSTFTAKFSDTNASPNVNLTDATGTCKITKTSTGVYSKSFTTIFPGDSVNVNFTGQNTTTTELAVPIPSKLQNTDVTYWSEWKTNAHDLNITWNPVTIADFSRCYGVFKFSGTATYTYRDHVQVQHTGQCTWYSSSLTVDGTQTGVSIPVTADDKLTYTYSVSGSGPYTKTFTKVNYSIFIETNHVYGCHYNLDGSTDKYSIKTSVENVKAYNN